MHWQSRQLLILSILLLVAIGLYGVVPQLLHVSASWRILRHAQPWFVGLAAVATLTTYALSALTYRLLSFYKLHMGRTLIVELAGLFLNRVVPAGLGGLGLNYLYLRTNKHTKTQAGVVVSVNNGLGFVGHALLTLTVWLCYPQPFHAIWKRSTEHTWVWLIVASLALIGFLIIYRQAKLQRVVQAVQTNLHHYARRPQVLVGSLLLSCGLTLANVGSFWLCCHALGIQISFAATFIAFTFGVALGTASPTPGGIGGAEAGLLAGLIAVHIATADALAAVLLYRLVSFWFGLLIGIVASAYMSQQHFVRLQKA